MGNLRRAVDKRHCCLWECPERGEKSLCKKYISKKVRENKI